MTPEPGQVGPSPEGTDPKEVFAVFGLAAYHGQVLEQEMIIVAVMLHLSGRSRIMRSEVEALFDTFEPRTLGQLLREVRSLTAVSSDIDAKLTEVLRRRNDLAHRFFARRAEDFMSDAGRSEMVQELRDAIALFGEADEALTAMREPLTEKLGISRGVAQRELVQMLARAAARDESV